MLFVVVSVVEGGIDLSCLMFVVVVCCFVSVVEGGISLSCLMFVVCCFHCCCCCCCCCKRVSQATKKVGSLHNYPFW